MRAELIDVLADQRGIGSSAHDVIRACAEDVSPRRNGLIVTSCQRVREMPREQCAVFGRLDVVIDTATCPVQLAWGLGDRPDNRLRSVAVVELTKPGLTPFSGLGEAPLNFVLTPLSLNV